MAHDMLQKLSLKINDMYFFDFEIILESGFIVCWVTLYDFPSLKLVYCSINLDVVFLTLMLYLGLITANDLHF